ncbi:MAG: hypothetical protein ACLU0O_03220 [Collinsella sp.]
MVRSVDSSLVDEWRTPATRRPSTPRRRGASTRSLRTVAAAHAGAQRTLPAAPCAREHVRDLGELDETGA